MKCWEYMKCGREKYGKNAKELGPCPVYPNYGNCCARVVGTLCDGKVQGVFAEKLKSCKVCPFYNSPNFDRAEEDIKILVIEDE